MKPKNNVYNDLKEISKEAREEFQAWNRQAAQYQLADYNTALCAWFACRAQDQGSKLKKLPRV